MVSPPQMPVPLKHMYIANIPRRKQCVLANYTQNYNIPTFFLIHQKQKQPYKAVICVRTL